MLADPPTARGDVIPAPGPATAPDGGALPTSVLLLLAAFSACITAQGGYYAGGQLVAGALLTAGFLAAIRRHPLSGDDLRSGPVLASAALACWTIIVAAIAGGDALPVLGLLAGVVAVLTVCRRSTATHRDALAVALLGIGVLVAVSGWVGVAWRLEPLALEDQQLWRAATTLTYANATAGLLVPLALLALGRQLGRRPSPAGATVTFVLLCGAGATLSRGGALAVLAGTLCLATLVGVRRTAGALVAPALGATVALAGLLPSMPAGSGPRPVLAVVALAAGAVVAAGLERAPANVRRGAVAMVLVAIAALMTLGPLDSARRPITSARLTLASADRRAETSAALRLVADRPVTGTGPGRATLFFAGPDGVQLAARYTHDEYLQALTELGAVGLGLVVVLLGSLVRPVRRGRATAVSPQLWAGAVAGLVALAVHSAFDFLWHVPALPLAGALLVGLTFPPATTGSPTTSKTTKEHA